MRALLLLVVLGITCQDLGQTSPSVLGLEGQETPGRQELHELLINRARLLYGPDLAKTLIFVNIAPPSQPSTAPTGPAGPAQEPPFNGSKHEETTRPMVMKGDVASGVILREEKDVLYLDLTPCRVKVKIFEFHSPFVKKRLDPLGCKGKKIDQFLVAQR